MRKIPNINTHIFKQPGIPWRILALDYDLLTGLKLILDDEGLVAGENNDYGNVTAGGLITSWKSLAPAPLTSIFSKQGTGVTLDANGVQFDGNGWLEETATLSFWDFMLSSSAQYTITMVVKCGVIADPDAIYSLMGNNGAVGTNDGIVFRYDDRLAQTNNDAFNAFISKNDGANASLVETSDDSMPTNELFVLIIKQDNSLSTGTVKALVNGVEVLSFDRAVAVITGNATLAMQIAGNGIDAQLLIGTFRTVIVQTGIYTTETATLITELMAKYSIS